MMMMMMMMMSLSKNPWGRVSILRCRTCAICRERKLVEISHKYVVRLVLDPIVNITIINGE